MGLSLSLCDEVCYFCIQTVESFQSLMDAEFCQMHFLHLAIEHKILFSLKIVYLIIKCVCVGGGCVYVEPFLHLRSSLIVVYDSFNGLAEFGLPILRFLASICIRDTALQFSCSVLIWLQYPGNASLIKRVQVCSLFKFWQFEKDQESSLKCWVEFATETIWLVLTFPCFEVFDYYSIFHHWTMQISYS